MLFVRWMASEYLSLYNVYSHQIHKFLDEIRRLNPQFLLSFKLSMAQFFPHDDADTRIHCHFIQEVCVSHIFLQIRRETIVWNVANSPIYVVIDIYCHVLAS